MGALTSLNKAPAMALPGKSAPASDERKGRPDEMPLNKIHPDPNNSRRPEDENTPEGIQEQRELTEDIKKRGVKSPISLRPHPKINGHFIINFGHRRFKGASEAGLTTIPYFIDVNFDSYDQVKENLLHRKPSIWALAAFIERKQKVDGQSMEQIAEGFGKESHTYVSELLSLVDAPECLHQAYAKGVKSPRTLYDLRRAYEEFPDQVDAWCDSGIKITRNTIQDLLQTLRSEAQQAAGGAANCRHDDKVEPVGTVPGSDADCRHDDKIIQPGEEHPDPWADVRGDEARLAGERGRLLQRGQDELARTSRKADGSDCRHDDKKVLAERKERQRQTSAPLGEILVQYKGKTAKIAPNATVMIVVAGHDVPLEVPLSELVFKGVQ